MQDLYYYLFTWDFKLAQTRSEIHMRSVAEILGRSNLK